MSDFKLVHEDNLEVEVYIHNYIKIYNHSILKLFNNDFARVLITFDNGDIIKCYTGNFIYSMKKIHTRLGYVNIHIPNVYGELTGSKVKINVKYFI